MERILKIFYVYIIPILLVLTIFIPFICIDGIETRYIYLSPFGTFFKWTASSVTTLIYVLINIAYLICSLINQTKITGQIRRVMLFTSVVLYFIIFKVTSNTNLNLLCVVINIFIGVIYIINFVRDYTIKPIDD